MKSSSLPTSRTAVAKWGNASAIRIPKAVMQKANLREGDTVHFEVDGPGVIVVRTAAVQRSLEDLVAGISSKNRHAETGWGHQQGREIW
ncbi:MAG TPA: AbrB/MazE/SpoVT family DNA-binding domain-containing protein [Bryobacteraceae bacterium]|jgi:antitoxin MazE|nr:AbrB/MazE/SpoVT family DNA-binding domain-containing protein [Bryobacteraceae bacterium]